MVRYSQRLYIMFLMEMAQRFSIDHDFLPKKKIKCVALSTPWRAFHSATGLYLPSNSFRNSATSYQDIIARAFFFFFFGGGGLLMFAFLPNELFSSSSPTSR